MWTIHHLMKTHTHFFECVFCSSKIGCLNHFWALRGHICHSFFFRKKRKEMQKNTGGVSIDWYEGNADVEFIDAYEVLNEFRVRAKSGQKNSIILFFHWCPFNIYKVSVSQSTKKSEWKNPFIGRIWVFSLFPSFHNSKIDLSPITFIFNIFPRFSIIFWSF